MPSARESRICDRTLLTWKPDAAFREQTALRAIAADELSLLAAGLTLALLGVSDGNRPETAHLRVPVHVYCSPLVARKPHEEVMA